MTTQLNVKPSTVQAFQPQDILGVSHVAIRAMDINKSFAFYHEFLGFQKQNELRYLEDGSLMLYNVKVSDTQSIEIFDGSQKPLNQQHIHQIAYQVKDAEALRAHLATKGFKVPEKVWAGQMKNLGFTVVDPDGYIIEFVQYTEEGWTKRDQGQFLNRNAISNHLSHIGVVVKESVKKTEGFYKEVLGFKETWRGSKKGDAINWINLATGSGVDYTELMLEEVVTPHFCFFVRDMAEAKRKLEATSYFKTYGQEIEIRIGTNKKRIINLMDPDGIRVELMEPLAHDGVPAAPSSAPLLK